MARQPHEHAEDRSLYPALARPLGRAEIDRLAYRLAGHLTAEELNYFAPTDTGRNG